MGALSEESAITVSSLSTDLWNNWTKNNAEGISFLFCLSLLVCHLNPKPTNSPPPPNQKFKQTQTKQKTQQNLL